MARLVPHIEDGELTDKFDVIDPDGTVLATGLLEIELIPGATRHGTLSFVTGDGDKRPLGAGLSLGEYGELKRRGDVI